jgi:hypothetical protein
MTKIYIYCLFDGQDNFYGAYSSIRAVHRDALKIANSGYRSVVLDLEGAKSEPTLVNLRNTLKGKVDVWIKYRGGGRVAKVVKTKLKE